MIESALDDAERYLEANPPGALTVWQEDAVRALFGTLASSKDSRKTAA